jgi:ABC-2 type transport system ATP-binding protein
VIEATVHGLRLTVTTTNSDATARELLLELDATNIEITSGSLESAFLTITGPSDRGASNKVEATR